MNEKEKGENAFSGKNPDLPEKRGNNRAYCLSLPKIIPAGKFCESNQKTNVRGGSIVQTRQNTGGTGMGNEAICDMNHAKMDKNA